MKWTTTLLAMLAVGAMLAAASTRADDSATAPAPGGASNTNAAPHRMMRRPGMERVASALNLTDEQKTQVRPIFDSERQQMREVFQQVRNQTISRDEGKAKIEAIRKATSAKLKSILTPDQFATWQKISHPHRHLMRTPESTNAPPAEGQ